MEEQYQPLEAESVGADFIGPGNVLGDAFEAALALLPDVASGNVEIDWIRSHPAMSRQGRENTSPIMLNSVDIATSPSKSAAIALQHWVNNQNDFFRMVLSEQKKSPEVSARDIEREEDPSLEEAERLLKQLIGNRVQSNIGQTNE
jgi:hypothetical protein